MKKKYLAISLLIAVSGLLVLFTIPDRDRGHDSGGFTLLNIYPHDSEAFTQGLVYDSGVMYESTGLYRRSSLRKVETETGKIIDMVKLPDRYFGEGVTIIDNLIYQLTWKAGKGFIYDKNTLGLVGTFSYETEGWGLTTDGRHLILSDGSASLYFLDSKDFRTIRTLDVTYRGSPLKRINELEYINGLIYANIWQTDRIAVINPETGEVENLIELKEIIGNFLYNDNTRVPNGIAYNKTTETFYITGKLWPRMFEISKKQ